MSSFKLDKSLPLSIVMSPEQFIMSVPGLLIRQKLSLVEIMTDIDKRNKYDVMPLQPGISVEQMLRQAPVLRIEEESECCERQCLGTQRSCKFHVFDMRTPIRSADIITIEKPRNCCEMPCCNRAEMVVRAPDGSEMSYTRNPYSCCSVTAETKDKKEDGTLMYKVSGSLWQMGLVCGCPCSEACVQVELDITDPAGTPVGAVRKEFGGVGREMCSPAETFSCSFPTGSTYQQRTAILGTTMLLATSFFEKKKKDQKRQDGGGGH